MSKAKTFNDGSSVDWVDKETLRYTKGEFSALIWVDFEPGFFSAGRIIRSFSIAKWEAAPVGSTDEIDTESKEEIINKIKLYYKSINKKCRVES
jgi:hypothetical protein